MSTTPSVSESLMSVSESNDLHRFSFDNNISALKSALESKQFDVNSRDIHGNTPLLIAIMLGHSECVEVLIEHGADANKKSRSRWSPMAEALSLGDRQIVTLVIKALQTSMDKQINEKADHVLAALLNVPDFYIEIAWDFHSWVPLVSRVLPSDTFKIWKKGLSIRLDSTLFDITEKSLKRANMSFIIEANKDSKVIIMSNINHDEQHYYQVPVLEKNLRKTSHIETEDKEKQLKDQQQAEEDLESDINFYMATEITDVDLTTSKMNFVRAQSGWFVKEDRCELVGPYDCSVYNIADLELLTRTRREHLTDEEVKRSKENMKRMKAGMEVDSEKSKLPKKSLPHPEKPNLTFDEYVAISNDHTPHLGRTLNMTVKAKPYKPTIWMTPNFPLSINDIVKILTVLAPAKKQIVKLKQFVETKLPSGFPVKLDIPIFPTISARVTFQNVIIGEVDAELMKIPQHYQEIEPDDEDSFKSMDEEEASES